MTTPLNTDNTLDLCKDCKTMKNVDENGLCGRCNPDNTELEEILDDIEFHPSDIEMDNERREYTKRQINALISKAIKDELKSVLEEQRKWIFEHAELKLGYATYVQSIIDDRIKELEGKLQ